MVDRVVAYPEGAIIQLELLLPFSYLKEVTNRARDGRGIRAQTTTSLLAGHCSSFLALGDPSRIRTYNQLIKSQLRYRCAMGPVFVIIRGISRTDNPQRGLKPLRMG